MWMQDFLLSLRKRVIQYARQKREEPIIRAALTASRMLIHFWAYSCTPIRTYLIIYFIIIKPLQHYTVLYSIIDIGNRYCPSPMRQTQEIQMKNQDKSSLTDRPMVQKLIPEPYDTNSNLLKNRPIFDTDFEVQEMSQPTNYLPKYNQNGMDADNCMASCQACCGDVCLCFGGIFPLCCMKCCVYELQTSSAGLVEAFGKFTRLLKPGFNRINPCSQQVREVDLRIRVLGTGSHTTITKDNVKISIETSIAFRVINPITVYYKLGNELNRAIIELVISSFRKVIGMHVLQQALTDRQVIVADVINQVNINMIPGIKIENVFIDTIVLPPEIENGLSSVARQKRVSQATIINSQADVQTAGLMKQSAELLDTKAAMQIRYLEMVQELGKRGVTVLMDIGVDKKGSVSYGKKKEIQEKKQEAKQQQSKEQKLIDL